MSIKYVTTWCPIGKGKIKPKTYFDTWNDERNEICGRGVDKLTKLTTEDNWTNLNGYRKMQKMLQICSNN